MPSVNITDVVDRQRPSIFLVNLLFWLALIMFFDGYNTQAVSYAAPSIMRDWHIARGSFGIVFSIAFAGALIGSIVFGIIADKIGRKPTIILTAVFFGLFTLGTAATTNVLQLCCLRFLSGLAIGGMLPPATALCIEFAPQKYRATFATIVTTGYMLGTGAGGIIAKLFVPAHGWQVIFVIGGVLSLAIAAGLVFTLTESIRFLVVNRQSRERIVRTLHRMDRNLIIAPDATITVADEQGADSHHGWVRIGMLFQGRLLWITPLLCLATMISSWETNSLMNWMPTLAESKGIPAGDAVLTLTLYTVAGTAGGLMLMRFLDRFGATAITILPISACLTLAALSQSDLSAKTSMGLFALSGFFIQGGHFGLSALCGLVFPSACRGNGYAVSSAVGRSGGIIGPLVGGLMFAKDVPLPSIFLVYAGIPLLLAVTVFLLGWQQRKLRQDIARQAAPVTVASALT